MLNDEGQAIVGMIRRGFTTRQIAKRIGKDNNAGTARIRSIAARNGLTTAKENRRLIAQIKTHADKTREFSERWRKHISE